MHRGFRYFFGKFSDYFSENAGILGAEKCLSYFKLVKVQLGDDHYPAAIGIIRNVGIKTSEFDNVIPPSPTEATATESTTFDYRLSWKYFFVFCLKFKILTKMEICSQN